LTGVGPGNPDLLVPAVLADISGANGVNSYAGSTTLVKTGAGYMQLSGANLYTGDTVVSNGTLEIAGGGAVLSTNLFDDGGTLKIDGGATLSSLNLIDNTGTVTLGSGVSLSTVTNVFIANGAKLDTSALGYGGLTLAAN
jgi:autotransporter-associated beta strand protein